MRLLIMTVLVCCWAPSAWGQTLHFLEESRLFVYEMKLETTFQSMGDELEIHTTYENWQLAIRGEPTDTGTLVHVTFLDINATLDAPGSRHEVRSSDLETGANDPLLGHLRLLAGVELVLVYDHSADRVVAVRGGEALRERMRADRQGAPASAIAQRFSDQALLRFWQSALAHPNDGLSGLDLPAPLSGSIAREWQGGTYTLTADSPSIPITIGRPPATISGTLSDIDGAGFARIRDGVLIRSEGRLSFTLDLTALTQGVEQTQQLQWLLSNQGPLLPAEGESASE